MLLTTGYEVAWTDVGDADLNDPDDNESIGKRLSSNRRVLTVSELESEVSDTEQIALFCYYNVPAGLSDKLLKSVRWLRSIYKPDFTE